MHRNSMKIEQHPSAIMLIDLAAMEQNLIQCRTHLQASTRIMLVLKAHAYGTRIRETTRWVQQSRQIDYIAVAFVEEGLEMRRVGITLPIMVMNVDPSAFDVCRQFQLEPVIYSLSFLVKLLQWLDDAEVIDTTNHLSFPSLHVKLNTGMNRMGINIDELPQMLVILSNTRARLRFSSVYSHLAASDDPAQDRFTAEQARLLLAGARILEDGLGYHVLKHLCNTFGIMRHPHLHFDMVRLGAGIFGGGCFPSSFNLLPALSLMTSISQVRRVKQGETVGYNRRGVASRDCRIGVLRIGYADGLRRRMGNGEAHVWVRNGRVPIIKGSVCMDMTTIDLTDVPVENDDELEDETVEIFGKHIDIQEVAQWCDTIAYELITSINQRVKRVYIGDSTFSRTKSMSDNLDGLEDKTNVRT